MPVLDVGYRTWSGDRTSSLFRWWVVAWSGIRLLLAGTALRRVMIVATIPTLLSGAAIGVFEQATVDDSLRQSVTREMFGRRMDRAPRDSIWQVLRPAAENPKENRHLVWTFILHWYFRYPQAICTVVMLGLVAPRLISYDLRSRGYLLYLSRPLTPWSYLIGKASVLYFLLAMITTLPALLIYLAGILMSTSSGAILETWDIPLRILLSTCVLVLPTTAVALALSSMTEESRFAGFGWFAIWIVGWVTYIVMNATLMRRFDRFEQRMVQEEEYYYYLSPYHLLGQLQREIFGLLPSDKGIDFLAWILCAGITILGYGIAYRRISRTLKV